MRFPLLLLCLLLGSYMLVYVNQPDSADGQALLAVSDTLARHGRFDINVIGYTEWLLTESGRMGSFGVDGALYAKKAPTPSLALLPLTLLARVLPWLPVRATAMLFNPLVTMLTALALFRLARLYHYSSVVAFTVGLIYGLATFAFPYVQTLFGEPLAALLLVLAMICGHASLTTGKPLTAASALAACGLLLGLLVGVNTIYVIFIPLFALYIFWQRTVTLRALLAFTAPLVVCGLLLMAYNWARFGSPLESGYHFEAGEGFTTPLLAGLYGLFLSPYRGLFWYSPVLLLALPGWLMLRRTQPRLAWMVLALVMLQALAFAGWWSWHGGIVWGPRFLLPALPFVVLCLAPLIAAAHRQRWLWAVLIGFGALSLLVQLLGVLYDYLIYEGYLRLSFWPDLATANQTLLTSPPMTDPAYSPISGHLALLVSGWPPQPALLQNGLDAAHLAAAALLVGTGFVVFFLNHEGAKVTRRNFYNSVVVLTALACCAVIVARQQGEAGTQAAHALNRVMQPPGVTLATTSLLDDALLELDGRVISMNAPVAPDDPRARQVFGYARQQGSPLWYVTWFGAADPLNWPERDLWESAYFVEEQTAAGHRALRFDLAPPQPADTPGGWQFGPITLDAYALAAAPDGVRLVLQWSAPEAITEHYQWFVHLLDASGAIIAQQDRSPQGGYAPTSTWTTGSTVTDRLFFPLAASTDVSGWQVRLGWIAPATSERLPVGDAAGESVPEDFIHLPLTR